MLTSTLFVSNIHCPSCVAYVQDTLRSLPGIQRIDVSIVDHRIEVQHIEQADLGKTIADVLIKAAFQVQHVSTTDTDGRTITEHSYGEESRATRSFPLFMSRAERKHIENCNACQATMSQSRKKRQSWRDVLTRARGALKQSTSKSGKSEKSQDLESGPRVTHVDGAVDSGPSRFTASLSVGGMTCGSCVSNIKNTVDKMKGVITTTVDLLSNSAVIEYSGKKDKINDIVETIEDIGYEATVVALDETFTSTHSGSDLMRASISIEGMTCSSCVNAVTEGLKSLPFVTAVSVNLVSNNASVDFSGADNLDKILEVIDGLGYDATKEDLQTVDQVQTKTSSERTIQIRVDGIFCEHCPVNIEAAVFKAFGDSLTISTLPSLRNPVMTVSYIPNPPQLTARHILSVIGASHDSFSASIFQPPTQEERSQSMRRREQRHILLRLLFTLIIAIPTFVIGIVFMSLVPSNNPSRQWLEQPVWAGNVTREEWALLIMTTPVMFFGADLFHRRALKEIRALWRPGSPTPILRRFYRFGSMNLLISAGTAVAYFSSLAVLIMDAKSAPASDRRSSDTYFDSVIFLSLFILVGRFLEAYSKAKTGDAVGLLTGLRPKEAVLIGSETDEKGIVTTRVGTDLLEIGDIVNVPHGESPPTDGTIAQDGTFLFNESSLTGESKPVKKVMGDKIFTGSVNVSQAVRMKVTDIGGTSMLDQIVEVVRKGQAKRAPIERIADMITGYFVPVITLIAIVTWVVWLALGESGTLPKHWLDVRQGGWAFWSLEFAIAVFVVACPCGIGLAAPTALYVGGGLAAKLGILVQGGGEAFQEASKINAIVFDKTGTLTEGQMKVTDFGELQQEQNVESHTIALTLAKALEEISTHPIARAVVSYCEDQLTDLAPAIIEKAEIQEISGSGLSGTFTLRLSGHDRLYQYFAAIGNERFLTELANERNPHKFDNSLLGPAVSGYQNSGRSIALLALQKLNDDENGSGFAHSFQPANLFAIADPVRDNALAVLDALRENHHIEVYMCTGDNVNTARAIAAQIGIPPSNIRAGVLPQEKAEFVQSLQTPTSTGSQNVHQRRRIVAFVGDGTNDTPALAAADVSIALSSGSDVAVGTASFILLNSDLETILQLVKLAGRVFRRVKMNFAWALVYNVCLVPVAAGVTYAAGQWRLGPVWASAAMAASSISVVLSSLALRWDFGRVVRLGGSKK